jgi:hypothetical protein
MADIQDLYRDVTTGGTGEFTLEHGGAEFTFSVKALTRSRKNEVLASLPEGFLDPSGLPDGLDPDELAEMDDTELVEAIEEAGGDVGELMAGQMLDADATETVIGAMTDSFSHEDLSDTELENMLRSSQFPDSAFNRMLNRMIEVSTPDEEMRNFRAEG